MGGAGSPWPPSLARRGLRRRAVRSRGTARAGGGAGPGGRPARRSTRARRPRRPARRRQSGRRPRTSRGGRRGDRLRLPGRWRSATLQHWAGSRAASGRPSRWSEATRPDRPGDPVPVLGGEVVPALGWCAPVAGPDRPRSGPAGCSGRHDDGVDRDAGRARQPRPPALGELGALVGPPDGAEWPLGRYVIELAEPDGRWYAAPRLDPPSTHRSGRRPVAAVRSTGGASPTPRPMRRLSGAAARARSRTRPGPG